MWCTSRDSTTNTVGKTVLVTVLFSVYENFFCFCVGFVCDDLIS